MKPSSAKIYTCRRCTSLFPVEGKERICKSCSSTCVKCGVTLTSKNRDTSAIKVRSYYICKSCSAETVRRTRDKEKQKEYDLQRHYGIGIQDYKSLLANQKGFCKICNTVSKLVVDHDHLTGKVRGLLCSPCNKGLGLFYDSSDRLKGAIKYLEEHETTISKK